MDRGEVLAEVPRRVPTAMTPGHPVPGARMPRGSRHGSSTARTVTTERNGTRRSRCTPSAFSSSVQVEHHVVAVHAQLRHGRPVEGRRLASAPMWPPPPRGTWVLDLDGVIWLAGRPIPGADEAVGRLRGAGVRVLFATNNSAPTRAQLQRQLAHCGITAADEDLLRSSDVAAGLLAPGSAAVVLGEDGIVEALAARGVSVVPEGPADAVVVGITRRFTYDALRIAAAAVRGGARLVGTNDDATFPTPDGVVPGAGSILAAVATAAEVRARGGRKAAPADGGRHRGEGRRRRAAGRGRGPPVHRRGAGRPAGPAVRSGAVGGDPAGSGPGGNRRRGRPRRETDLVTLVGAGTRTLFLRPVEVPQGSR